MTTCCERARPLAVLFAAAALLMGAAPAASGDSSVSARDNAFQPARSEVPAGTRIEWRNDGLNPHTVTAQSGAPASFDSGTIAARGTFSFTFETPGTYHFYCRFHGSPSAPPPDCGMCGTVVVTARVPGRTAPPSSRPVASPRAAAAPSPTRSPTPPPRATPETTLAPLTTPA
ncbi:MAG TPA: cupredoxin domain-containing protein, partial [Actinomycetota bacterium]|nr:cupredoxin domain-containing protein [Actinomycetota bacterium]